MILRVAGLIQAQQIEMVKDGGSIDRSTTEDTDIF
jgi:hypothetical protein